MPTGGPFDCYPPGYPGYSYPYWLRETSAPSLPPNAITVHPSVMEQMGTDPISKLAAAIEKLAAALGDGGTKV